MYGGYGAPARGPHRLSFGAPNMAKKSKAKSRPAAKPAPAKAGKAAKASTSATAAKPGPRPPAGGSKVPRAGKARRGGLEAAAAVLAQAGKPLSCEEILAQILEGGL